MKVIVNIVLIGFLIGCLFKMPYGYYQFAKICITAGSIYSAYNTIHTRRYYFTPVYVGMAILFNPFMKFAFRRNQWQTIDMIAIAVMDIITLVLIKFNRKLL